MAPGAASATASPVPAAASSAPRCQRGGGDGSGAVSSSSTSTTIATSSTRRRRATTTTTAAPASPVRRRTIAMTCSFFCLALMTLSLLLCTPSLAAAAAAAPWPDAVSPATRRRLLQQGGPHAWDRSLGVDRHGRRRTLLTSTMRRCGTHAPEKPQQRLLLDRARAAAAARAREAAYRSDSGGQDGSGQRTIEVPTYVTIVLRDNDGPTLVSDATVNAQIDVLNKAYGSTVGSPTKFVFLLKGIARVKASGAAAGNGAAGMCDKGVEAKVKKESRHGGPGTLNLYFADLSDCGLLGFSSWPWDLATNSLADDGVVIHFATLPGGTYKPYNMGYTAVHEIGHWWGLHHTFQNGCNGPGDSVDDTNYVAKPTEGCPKVRDTCPQPGNDPVTNPMDYADDACMETFTVGQHARMESMFRQYRGGNGTYA